MCSNYLMILGVMLLLCASWGLYLYISKLHKVIEQRGQNIGALQQCVDSLLEYKQFYDRFIGDEQPVAKMVVAEKKNVITNSEEEDVVRASEEEKAVTEEKANDDVVSLIDVSDAEEDVQDAEEFQDAEEATQSFPHMLMSPFGENLLIHMFAGGLIPQAYHQRAADVEEVDGVEEEVDGVEEEVNGVEEEVNGVEEEVDGVEEEVNGVEEEVDGVEEEVDGVEEVDHVEDEVNGVEGEEVNGVEGEEAIPEAAGVEDNDITFVKSSASYNKMTVSELRELVKSKLQIDDPKLGKRKLISLLEQHKL